MFELNGSTLVWTESDYIALKFLEKKLSRSCAKKKLSSLVSRWSQKLMKDGFKEAKDAVQERAKEGAKTGQEAAEVVEDDIAEGEEAPVSTEEDIQGDLAEDGETCADETIEHEDPPEADTAEFAEQSEDGENEHVEDGELINEEEDQANNCTEVLEQEEGGELAADEENANDDEDTEYADDGNDEEAEVGNRPSKKKTARRASESKKRASKPKNSSKKRSDDAVERYADKAIDDLCSSWTKSFDSDYARKLWIYQRVNALRSSFDGKRSMDVSALKRSSKDAKADVAAWNWLVAHKDWSTLEKSAREKMIKILIARDKKVAKPTVSTADSQKSIYFVAVKSFFERSDSAQ